MHRGADIHAVNHEGNNFLHFCVGHGYGLEVSPAAIPGARQMLQAALGSGVNVQQEGSRDFSDEDDEQKQQPIHAACEHAAAWAIAPLVAGGADVNARNGTGKPPLILMCYLRKWLEKDVLVQALLAAGADVHAVHVDPRWEGGDNTDTALEILSRDFRRTKENPYHDLSSSELHTIGAAIAAVVAAGDRRLDLIPAPCPGLEAALVQVWKEAKGDLPGLFQRLEPAVQERVRTALLVMKRFRPGMPEDLRWAILGAVLA